MCKADIEKAFRIVPIAPQQHCFVGFNVNGPYYVDTYLSMGLNSSCKMCETFSSALELVARRQLHIPHILHMINELMILPLSKHISENMNTLADLLSRFQITKFRERAPWSDHRPTSVPKHILPPNWSLT